MGADLTEEKKPGACRSGKVVCGRCSNGASHAVRGKQLAKIVNKRQKTYSTRSHILKQNTHKKGEK